MANGELTGVGLHTLEHQIDTVRQDYDYTQYWRDYDEYLNTAGYDTGQTRRQCNELTDILERCDSALLHGGSVREHDGTGGALSNFSRTIGNLNRLGESGHAAVLNAASLMLQTGYKRNRLAHKLQPESIDETLDMVDDIELLPKVALKTAQLLHIAALTEPDYIERLALFDNAKTLYDREQHQGGPHQAELFSALAQAEDIDFHLATENFVSASENGDTLAKERFKRHMTSLVGRQALRISQLSPKTEAGKLLEVFVPWELRCQVLEDLDSNDYDPRIGCFAVRQALTHEDQCRLVGARPKPNFDIVLQRVTDHSITTTPIQLKLGQHSREKYLMPVVYGNGISTREMIMTAKDVAETLEHGSVDELGSIVRLKDAQANLGNQIAA